MNVDKLVDRKGKGSSSIDVFRICLSLAEELNGVLRAVGAPCSHAVKVLAQVYGSYMVVTTVTFPV